MFKFALLYLIHIMVKLFARYKILTCTEDCLRVIGIILQS